MVLIVVSREFNTCIKHRGCHFDALEGDAVIFEAILAPLCGGNSLVTCGSVPQTTNLADDDKLIQKVENVRASTSKFAIALVKLPIFQYFVFIFLLVYASNYLL